MLPVRDVAGQVRAVLDIDSVVEGDFDVEDANRLQRLLDRHAHRFYSDHED